MKYSDLYDGPIIDLTHLAEEQELNEPEEPDNDLEECETSPLGESS